MTDDERDGYEQFVGFINGMEGGDFIIIMMDQSGKFIVTTGSLTDGIVETGFGPTLLDAWSGSLTKESGG